MRDPKRDVDPARRAFARALVIAAPAIAINLGNLAKGEAKDEAEVTPGEDLMQEHGVVDRILLIYDEAAHRLEHGLPLDPAVVVGAAGIVRAFVENYHEHT